MKIIGRTDNGYLISATEDEIPKLFGISYSFTDEWKEVLKEQNLRTGNLIGLTINAGYAYEQLDWLRRRNSEFDELTRKLRRMADMIDSHRPLFDAVAGDKQK